jgi:nucleoside-diphosphate-sugar epimerase|tara:strand:- start:2211 stop:3401 length:1191 start_codon:yes stop_codon:yes gene_type:complete
MSEGTQEPTDKGKESDPNPYAKTVIKDASTYNADVEDKPGYEDLKKENWEPCPNPTILITGGAGYIGTVLVQKLMESKKMWGLKDFNMKDPRGGWWKDTYPNLQSFKKLIVYDNLMYQQTPLTQYCYRPEFEFVNGDVRDQDKLKKYVEQADIVIPLAAIVGAPACERDKELATAVNYEHVKFLCENAKPKAKIVYPNTNSGYGIGEKGVPCTEDMPLNPISHYGRTKCDAEKVVLEHGGIVFRLATVFGVSPRQRLDLLVNDFTYKAYKDGYIVLFEQDFVRNYIHVQDVALAFMRGIHFYTHPKKMMTGVYNVGLSSANLSKLELAEKIKEQVPGFSIQYDDIAEDPDKRDYIVSNAKFENQGWRPRYTLERGITELLKAFEILGPSLNKYTNL